MKNNALPTRRSALLAERTTAALDATAPAATPPALRAVSKVSRRGRIGASSRKGMAALLLAWTFAVTQGIPAYAVEPIVQSATTARVSTGGEAQTLTAEGAATDAPRDSFTVTVPPPPPPPPATPRFAFAAGRTTFVNIATSVIQWPFASSPISSDFGARKAPCRGCSSDHKGLDFTPGSGTPIAAAADGIVKEVNRSSGGLGTNVLIDHQIGGQLVTTVYGHMQAGSVPLVEGQTVSVGAMVGRVGNTGASTGAHLHFEVHIKGSAVDPYAWLTANVR
jgi:murein DD-endopeptidase MepM/ murein hydrolase activator NlpD